MSVTAIGPALNLDGPLPVAPPHSLLSIPGVLVGDGGRWMNGVNLWSYPTDPPATWEPCSTGTFRTKEEGGELLTPRFDAFGIYTSISCSAFSMGDPNEFADRARIALEATQSFAIEEALSQGVTLSTNPFFGDANVTVLGGGAVSPQAGLSWLENAIGETGRTGIIHAPPAVVAAWDTGLVTRDDGYLRTMNGTPVAAGGGYIGASANGQEAPSGSSYVFATGPVEVRLSEMQTVGDSINGSLDTSNNDVTFRAEKYALAVWDTALQAAVLIDWTP